MDINLEDIRRRHIGLMGKTRDTLRNITSGITQETATTYRDSGDGWTVLETLCHLRDFDGFFQHRAQMMLEQEHPQLPAYDHDALVIEREYNKQDLQAVMQELNDSRDAFIAFFQSLDEAGWSRTGIHPERGHFTMLDALMQVGLHDADHTEQITRILAEKKTGAV